MEPGVPPDRVHLELPRPPILRKRILRLRERPPFDALRGRGLRYGRSRRLLRKTIAQGYQDVEPPLTVADRPTRAAGTLSLLETTATSTPLGFQVLGGVDYAVDERTSIRINAHWAPLLHGRCPVSTLLRTQPPPSRLRPFSRGLRLCGLPCSVDFSTGRGRLLQWLGMSLSPCCPYHPVLCQNSALLK